MVREAVLRLVLQIEVKRVRVVAREKEGWGSCVEAGLVWLGLR